MKGVTITARPTEPAQDGAGESGAQVDYNEHAVQRFFSYGFPSRQNVPDEPAEFAR
jgi:hypothetical protein